MVNLKMSNNGIIVINSVLMGTQKKQAVEELRAAGFSIKDNGDNLIVGLLANNIPPDSIDALHLNVNDLGDVCDGFAFHTHLSYSEAYELQNKYVRMIDKLKIKKILRGRMVTSSIVYSYENEFFKVEVARWREGGNSADIPTNVNDYAVSIFITSLVEEIKTVNEMKRLVYRSTGSYTHSHKTIWFLIILTGIVIVGMLLNMLWSAKDQHYTPKEKDKIEKCIYVDMASTLHTKEKCTAIFKTHNMQAVRPIYIDEVTVDALEKICSQCVTEEQLDLLKSIADDNTGD